MYKILSTLNGECIQKTNEDGSISSIPKDEANTDYQKYLQWLSEGNIPLPPDPETV
jgi:hypothetical protein